MSDFERARLEGRISALERALERRSRELRALQRHLSARDLVLLSRVAEGLAPLPRFASRPEYWRETPELTKAEVEPVLKDLWASESAGGDADRSGGRS